MKSMYKKVLAKVKGLIVESFEGVIESKLHIWIFRCVILLLSVGVIFIVIAIDFILHHIMVVALTLYAMLIIHALYTWVRN